jgi:hypothetical protein
MQFVTGTVMMACVGVGLAHLLPDRVRPFSSAALRLRRSGPQRPLRGLRSRLAGAALHFSLGLRLIDPRRSVSMFAHAI